MSGELPPVTDVLAKLPWFHDLTATHQSELIDQIAGRLTTDSTREDYETILARWAGVAHGDAKRTRLELLRQSGLLAA